MIEKLLPSNRTRVRILESIYNNPGINITELIEESKSSPNIVIEYVNVLTKYDVVKEVRSGGMKKTHLRNLKPNLSSNVGRLVFTLVEIEKKYRFLEKYTEFKPFVRQLEDLFTKSGVNFCLIHGSFARFTADKDSDVDVLIVGKLKEKEQRSLSEIFITLKRVYSIEVEKLSDFYKNVDNPFHQSIIRNHTIVWNEYGFVNCLSGVKK